MSIEVARFHGPPAERMVGRPSLQAQAALPRAYQSQKGGHFVKAKVSTATVQRANAFLEREALLDQAIYDGRISAGLRDHYARCFDADPAGTRAFLAKLAGATGSDAGAEDYPDSFLSEGERKRVAAAKEGRQYSRIIHGGL
jgi:hypothetical protein